MKAVSLKKEGRGSVTGRRMLLVGGRGNDEVVIDLSTCVIDSCPSRNHLRVTLSVEAKQKYPKYCVWGRGTGTGGVQMPFL